MSKPHGVEFHELRIAGFEVSNYDKYLKLQEVV